MGFLGKAGAWVAIFLISLAPSANSVIITFEIDSQSSINFTTNPPSFQLTFAGFGSGSLTNPANVSYTVSANNVTRSQGVLTAGLDDTFPGIELQADFGSYVKDGGNAHLVGAQPGYVAVTTQSVSLADKVNDAGNGKLLDGHFDINYRARAVQDLSAGSYYRILTITFTEN